MYVNGADLGIKDVTGLGGSYVVGVLPEKISAHLDAKGEKGLAIVTAEFQGLFITDLGRVYVLLLPA